MSRPAVGERVEFVGADGTEHCALVSQVHGSEEEESPLIDLVYVDETGSTRPETSVYHEDNAPDGAKFWRESE